MGDIVFSCSNEGVRTSIFCSMTSENNSWSIVRPPLVIIDSPKLESKLAQPVSILGSTAFSPQGLEGNAFESKNKYKYNIYKHK